MSPLDFNITNKTAVLHWDTKAADWRHHKSSKVQKTTAEKLSTLKHTLRVEVLDEKIKLLGFRSDAHILSN